MRREEGSRKRNRGCSTDNTKEEVEELEMMGVELWEYKCHYISLFGNHQDAKERFFGENMKINKVCL